MSTAHEMHHDQDRQVVSVNGSAWIADSEVDQALTDHDPTCLLMSWTSVAGNRGDGTRTVARGDGRTLVVGRDVHGRPCVVADRGVHRHNAI